MRSELLTRARSAVTVEEEALVVFEAVQHSPLPVEQKRELCRIVMMAGKEVPRAVLLGVVAALVPADAGWSIDTHPLIAEVDGSEGAGATPALALLIAIMEAGNG